jgi:hypothetical protein
MKKSIFFTFLVTVPFLLNAIKYPAYWFIVNNGIYTYFPGTSEPPANWKTIDFDDSGWSYSDSTAIGYGWVKPKSHVMDSVVVVKTTSLYMRISFNVSSTDNFKDLNFEADYDDGYIAYLNGEEIARKNAGMPGEPKSYNSVADGPREETTYRYYEASVNGVYIDSSIVKRLIKPGKNVFAIQVLNDSINGSDLSFVLNVYNIKGINYYYGSRENKYYRQVNLDSSKFPIVFINTNQYGVPLKDLNWSSQQKKVIASMEIIYPKNGISKTNANADFKSRIELERRGQSSRDFPKICYNIETQQSDGTAMDTAIMGMPSESDWVLNSNYGDKTLIRNELTFCIGCRLGHYVPRTQYCEMIYNGEYQGLYLFTEKIKRGKNRVNVAKRDSLNPEEGGFVFKYDKNNGGAGGILQYVYPKADEITKAETDYFMKNLNSYFAVLNNGRLFLSLDSGYRKYVSTKTLIDYVIVNEISKNCDAYLNSTYLYKDKNSNDGRIKFGPLWDYDIAYGGAIWQNGGLTDGWQFSVNTTLRIHQLFRDTALTHEFSRKWKSLRTSFLAENAFLSMIDSLTNNILESRLKNYDIWPILDKQYLWPVTPTYTYDDDLNVIKNFTTKRMKWIDDNIDKIYFAPLEIDYYKAGMTNIAVNIYPNPFADHINVNLIDVSGDYKISIQNIEGKTICSKLTSKSDGSSINIQFAGNEMQNLKNGIYFLMIYKNGQLVNASKIVRAAIIN